MDSRIRACPIMNRWNKIHEIAGHIGQVDQRISQVGAVNWLDEQDHGDFRHFTEQSIAPVEKCFIDALPLGVIDEDLLFMQDSDAAQMIKDEIIIRQKMSYDKYVRLEHRTEKISDKQHHRLHSRNDLMEFNSLMDCESQSQSYNPNDIQQSFTVP